MSRDLDSARRRLTDRVMGRPGVEGTAVGEREGKPCLIVYVSSEAAAADVPKEIEGVAVVVESTGPFRAR